MKFKIEKIKLIKTVRYEVRAWDGSGDTRNFWRRRFDSKAEAQNFIDAEIFKERQIRSEVRKTGGDPLLVRTFKTEYESWHGDRYRDLAHGWKRNVDQYWRDFETCLGDLTVAQLNSTKLRELERKLRDAGNSRATVRRKLGWIQSVLNYSVEMERIPYSPIARFRSAKPLKPELEFWQKEETADFLEFALKKYPSSSSEHWKYLVYLTALNTALRSGELWALKPNCLRPQAGTIRVTEQLGLTDRTFRSLKGKEARNVPLSPDLATALSAWVAAKRLGPSELLLTGSAEPIDHNNFAKRVFVTDMKSWAGKRIKFHGLRHTSATLMLDAGVNIRTVQDILGHKNIETTLRYVHALGDNVKRAAAIFSVLPNKMPMGLVG